MEAKNMSINQEELLAIQRMLDDAVLVVEDVHESWKAIKWVSADKDNMEFTATITTFHRDKINQLFEYLIGNSGS